MGKRIDISTANDIRTAIHAGKVDCRWVEYGQIEKKVATGRATCRVCGMKIAKGIDEVSFPWDISSDGCGSFTTTTVHIHFYESQCGKKYLPLHNFDMMRYAIEIMACPRGEDY